MLTILTVTRIAGVAFLTIMALPKAATLMVWEGNILMLTITMIVGMFMVVLPFFERVVAYERGWDEGRRQGRRAGRYEERSDMLGTIPEGSIAYAVLNADEDDADPIKRNASPETIYWSVPASPNSAHRQLVPEPAGWVLHMLAVLNGQKLYEAAEDAAEEDHAHA